MGPLACQGWFSETSGKVQGWLQRLAGSRQAGRGGENQGPSFSQGVEVLQPGGGGRPVESLRTVLVAVGIGLQTLQSERNTTQPLEQVKSDVQSD